MARLAAGAWWRTNLWTAQSALRATRRLAEATRSGESAAALVDDTRREVARTGRRLLGISEPERRDPGTRDVAAYDDEPLPIRSPV